MNCLYEQYPASTNTYKRSALLLLVVQSVFRAHTAQIKMSCNNQFFQQGYGKILYDSEDSESSQESEHSSQSSTSSEEMESSQEEEASIDPWSRIQDEVTSRHETQLEAMINEYEQHGDSSEVARVKAENALLPVYRKELRKVLLEYLQWMHAMKNDSTFRKVMETKNELKDTEGSQSIVCQTTRSRKLNELCLCTVLITHLIAALLSINVFG